jgi:predicted metal-binding membrane protein
MSVSVRIRAMRAPHWIGVFGGILAAWVGLYLMSIPAELRSMSNVYGLDFWQSLCVVTPDASGYLRIFAMWSLMSAAMMAPTALPAFATYEDLGHVAETSFWTLVAGYGAVWIGFSAIAAAVQLGLFSLGLIDAFGQSGSMVLSAVLLIGAGAYQFTSLKEACLSKCRMPMTFFMERFEDGPWRNGVQLGLVCLGCCWALMLLAFVGGVMNLAFMGLATVMMTIEKLPQIGRFLTRPLGFALISWGILLIIFTLI